MSPILGGIGGVSVRGFGHFPNLYFASYDSIATVNITSNGQSATFSSIPQTYTHLQIRVLCRGNDGNDIDSLYMRFNGLAPASGYPSHYLRGTGSAAEGGSSGPNNYMYVAQIISNGNAASIMSGSVIDILDYTNTNKYKTVRAFTGFDTNGAGAGSLGGSIWFSSGFLSTTTNAITSIDVSGLSGGFRSNGQVALYGIKVA